MRLVQTGLGVAQSGGGLNQMPHVAAAGCGRASAESWATDKRELDSFDVKADVESTIAEPVPMNLRNASTRHMKEWGYSEGYQHAHKFENAVVDMDCLPPSLAGRQYYRPTDRGSEKRDGDRRADVRVAQAGEREGWE